MASDLPSYMRHVWRSGVKRLEILKPQVVVVLLFDPDSLQLGPFLWFGGPPGEPLPDLGGFAVAKHAKGNAQGVKLPRANSRVLPRSALASVGTVGDLAERLSGSLSGASRA